MDSRDRGVDEKLNNWVQAIGIIAAAIWALYTFVYKEYWFPKSVPVNVSINLKLQKTGVVITDEKYKNGLVPIEIHVSANNPTSRTSYLLPSVFIVYAYKIIGPDPSLKDDNDLCKISKDRAFNMKYCALSNRAIVAVGKLIDNIELKPAELVATTLVFYVPVGEYDVIEAHAYIPNAKDAGEITLTWSHDTELGLMPTLFHINHDGTMDAILRDSSDGYPTGEEIFQRAHSKAMMSLW